MVKMFRVLTLFLILIFLSCSSSDKNPYENELRVVVTNIDEQQNLYLRVSVKITNITNRHMRRIGLTCLAGTGNGKLVKKREVLSAVGKMSLAPGESVNYLFIFNNSTEEATSMFVGTDFIHYLN